ncbi:agamous-like MADS-box protein AGL80 [Curcuma longa]|uniref:agamous-like MADS-box protein AGL80 n=1 Tax=Curcuma longa TaxID=136217 RepID=UPI003D9F5BB5
MARKKVKLEWIANDAARKATFKKRKKGLVKKVSELSTLCDVKACMIVYAPGEAQAAEVWPSAPDAVRVLSRLKRLPETEQSKKMMNQEKLMEQRVRKLQEQFQRHDKENRDLETALLMQQCLEGRRGLHDVGIEEVKALAWMTEVKMGKVRERMEEEEARNTSATAAAAAATEERKGKATAAAAAAVAAAQEVAVPTHDWFAEAMGIGGYEGVAEDHVDSKINSWLHSSYYPLN